MKVLIVSFLYPPFSSISGYAVSKVSHYLFEQGWDVRVLCGRHPAVPEDLPVELPPERVVRTGFFDVNALPKLVLGRSHVVRRGFEFRKEGLLTALGRAYRNVVNFPDGQIGWYPHAVRAGTAMIRASAPDVILAGTPWTSHLVASRLSRKSGIPWVGWYHDPWTDSRARGARSRIWPLSAVERALEDRNTSSASMLIMGSEAWRAQLATRFPRIPVHAVSFGFEPADYGPVPPPRGLPLRLTYTGRLYERQDPAQLFGAVKLLLRDGRLRPEEIRLRFVGRYLDVARRALARVEPPDGVVTIEDPLPHDEVVALQQQASALVLFLGEDDDIGLLPAKTWEYMGARRPVLVIGGTEGNEALAVLRRARVGTWARGPQEIAAVLARWTGELRASGRLDVDPDEAVIGRHEWADTAAGMGELLREAARRHRGDVASG